MATATQQAGRTRGRASSASNRSGAASSARGGTSSKSTRNGRAGSSGAKPTRAAAASRSPSRPAESSRSKPTARTRAPSQSTKQSTKATQGNNGSPPAHMRERAADTISSAVGNVRETASEAGRSIGIPVATGTIGAAAGIAGGVLLGRTIASRPRKILGIKLPRQQANFSDVARGMGDAGKQFGKLAREVRAARQKAEEVGKALS